MDPFSKIWGILDLLVSFDGINMTLPLASSTWPNLGDGRTKTKIRGFQCAQGIINSIDNGLQDGRISRHERRP